ncbi:hypothetical protein Tco_1557099 [Tanacetum coccineum]
MAFDLRPTKDVLPWPGNANMAFDLRPTEDVLPWPGNANMAFDLRPTEDVLSWPGNANMAFDLVPDLQCLLRTFYIRRYLRDMHEDNYNGIVLRLMMLVIVKKTSKCKVQRLWKCPSSLTGDLPPRRAEHHERTELATADVKEENKSGRADK